MSGVTKTTTEPYHVEGWPSDHATWWVEARNHRTVATCRSERMARRIAALLNADSPAPSRPSTPGD